MRYLIFTFLLSTSLFSGAFSQDLNVPYRNLELYFIPLTMLQYTPRIRAGVEYNTDQYGYNLDAGIGRYNLFQRKLNKSSWTPDYTFVEFRPEIKYFYNHDQDIHHFAAGELLVTYTHDNLVKGHFHSPDGRIDYESASVNRLTYGFNFKGGEQMVGAHHILIEIYYGLGFFFDRIYYTHVVETDQEYDTNFVDDKSTSWALFKPGGKYKYQANHTRFRPNLTLGIKFGYIF